MTATRSTDLREVPTSSRSTPYPGLNLLRLVLASAVLVSHAFPAFGLHEPQLAGRSLGGWAVLGFFALSGFLIAQSRRRLDLSPFLARRLGRLMPGYWVCLVVTTLAATVFTPASLSGNGGGLSYALSNAMLFQMQSDITGTPMDVPYAGVWNASAWTLPHEFLCYLAVGLTYSLVQRVRLERAVVVLAWLGFVALQVTLPHTPIDSVLLKQFSLLAPLFFGGVVVAVCTSGLRLRPIHAAAAGLAALLLVVVEPRFGASLAAPLLVTALLTLGQYGGPRIVQRHDISYGVYLYAFPVSQVLVGVRKEGWSFPVYVLAIAGVTAVLALASWVLVERPAQRWIKHHVGAGHVSVPRTPSAT